jgi:hypothetical protein
MKERKEWNGLRKGMFELLKNKFTTFAKIWKWIGAEI